MVFHGLDWSKVSKIEFAFSQKIGESPLKTATYPGDNTELIRENMVGVIWTPTETTKFEAGKPFYADTRITLSNSQYQPETPIVRLQMNPTLFEGWG